MTQEHHNELILLSQKVYDQATDEITNYCAAKYCGVGNDTTEQQLEDYLFVAEETSAYLLGNAYALLDPVDPSSEQVREGYQDTMNEIRRQVNDGEAVLVFFGINSWVAEGDNWITQLCEGLPFIYRDTSEWVIGK